MLLLIGLTGSALAFESDPDWAGPSQHGELIILIDPKVSRREDGHDHVQDTCACSDTSGSGPTDFLMDMTQSLHFS
jgi:hypothetical protein